MRTTTSTSCSTTFDVRCGFIAIRAARADQAADVRPRRQRSPQLSLLPASGTLDDGEWEHNVS